MTVYVTVLNRLLTHSPSLVDAPGTEDLRDLILAKLA